MEKFQVVACPSTELSYTNKAIINPEENFAQFPHIAVRYPRETEAFVFSVTVDRSVARGKIAFNLTGRKWANLLVDSVIEAAPYKFEPLSQCLNTISFLVDFASRKSAATNADYDTDEMARQFSQRFAGQAFTVGQLVGFPFRAGNKNIIFELKVKEMQAVNMGNHQVDSSSSNVEIGLTTANTIAMFERAEGSDIRLTGRLTNQTSAPKIFGQDWDFANMGIGGLSDQFNTIFRRAFLSRLFPPHFAQEIELDHVKGILLFGPPGTGKTLIARQIGKLLLAREPKVVNGPEIFNKFVGESEANIRKLFAEAEEEQKKAGINSGLHVIIFDEIDAICKARSGASSAAGAGDNVVNQLLTMIDGVNSLNNVLVIGMTNRRDLIDEALLRPGRLDVQIEIGLPNKEGRLEIFKIHTAKLMSRGILDESVDLEELAEITKNYTGAEIKGLVAAARSVAFSRVVKADAKVQIDEEKLKSIKLTMADFQHAMKYDIKPALGASEDQLKTLAREVIEWDPTITKIQSDLDQIIRHIKSSKRYKPFFVLLTGEPGSGTTTLAANMAAKTGFPFIRIYQSRTTAGKSEGAKVQHIEKLFDDAARSELSCVVIDRLESILDYRHFGPTWSNTTKNVIFDSIDLDLPKGHRMLVICTCSREQMLDDLLLREYFRKLFKVPHLTKANQVRNVMTQMREAGTESFGEEQIEDLISSLATLPFKVGIKNVVELIEEASDDEPQDRIKLFLERMLRYALVKF